MIRCPQFILVNTLASVLFLSHGTLLAAPKKVEAPPLSPEAQKAHDGYAGMLEALRGELKPKLSEINAPEEYNAHVVGLMYSEFGQPPFPPL